MTLLSDLLTGLLIARRARYFSTSLWLLLVVIGLSLMAAQFSGKQPATVALDVGLSAVRLLLPILVILLTQELLSREFDRRYFLITLTYPRARHWMLAARLITVLLLVYALLVIMGLSLAGIAQYLSSSYTQATPVDLGKAYWITLSFIGVDLFVLAAFASFLAIVASTPSFVLIGTLGFMLIARSYSTIISLLENKHGLVGHTQQYQQSLEILHYLLPDLASLDVRMISLYGKMELLPADWFASLSACIAYAVILVSLAVFYLQRKKFN